MSNFLQNIAGKGDKLITDVERHRIYEMLLKGDVYEDVGARGFMFELYAKFDKDGYLQNDINSIELVNYEWNPFLYGEGIGGFYHIWRIKDDRFVENKSITVIDSENKGIMNL